MPVLWLTVGAPACCVLAVAVTRFDPLSVAVLHYVLHFTANELWGRRHPPERPKVTGDGCAAP
ncbi:hypothetical protein SAM40697_5236 [Streptomyces ambofaciens]|uniref:Integral membrane protein n=1 Tax=Streptomyces ambofaciens TaxID=1889 RepID=A0ABN4PD58_STRAM|nr:hypothetical protein [Streptomyces ambofaciens]ANB09192.1 hypothetical protein SAM40697_5236 [Streptomyces ambofaciens]